MGEEQDTRRSLVYSPDDGGWYWERWSDDATSVVYPSEAAARSADPIEWEPTDG